MAKDRGGTGGELTRRELLAGASLTMGALAARAALPSGLSPPQEEKPMSANELCFKTASELAGLLRRREISAKEVLTAHLAQIERVNPKVNAICTLVAEQALAEAELRDRAFTRSQAPGALHGLPLAVKDLALTRGIRTTFGSRIYQNFVPEQDALFVERVKAAGAVVIGKTNTPEFGAGSQTFNQVFGETRNPYDLSRTCGGSSGGGAVALACGMVPLADGSDFGGSLRNPPSFCNVVGLRPSPGRVPHWPARLAWQTLSVLGPMGRTVRDAALLLSVMAGPDPRSPISLPEPGDVFARPLERDFKGTRIAWSRNLGRYPVEPVVNEVIDRARPAFVALGCEVEEGEPDFSDADEAFQALRAFIFAFEHEAELLEHRALMKDTVIWNTEQGLALDGLAVSRAEAKRTLLYQRVREFLERYEFLVLPVSQVAPFPLEVRWVKEINGIPMKTYIDWMATCYAISLTGLPAISVPCGFTPEGLPIGLQIVGRHQKDFEVLQLAHAFEQASGVGKRRPSIAR
jgi:amidase